MQINDNSLPQLADFYVSVTDDDGAPVPDYIIRLDGKILGRTNVNGMVARSGMTIGNLPTIYLSMVSRLEKFTAPKETLLTLPPYKLSDRPAFSISSSLCLDFVVCDDDLHTITAGRVAPKPSQSKTPATEPSGYYEFRLTSSQNHDRKTISVIRELDKLLTNDSAKKTGIPIDVKFSSLTSEKFGSMIKITGHRPQSASAKGDFAFLLPLKDDPSAMSRDIHRFLMQSHPSKLPEGKIVRMRLKEPLNDSYEIFAGGVAGEVVSADSWNLIVPATGRFFLTVVRKGQVIVRKFFDASSSDVIDYESN